MCSFVLRLETIGKVMKRLRIMTIAVIVLNAVTVVGAGHGIAVLGLLEVLMPFFFFEGFIFSFEGSYSERLQTASLIGATGQFLLISSFLIPKRNVMAKVTLKLGDSFILFWSFFVLTRDFTQVSISALSAKNQTH